MDLSEIWQEVYDQSAGGVPFANVTPLQILDEQPSKANSCFPGNIQYLNSETCLDQLHSQEKITLTASDHQI